METSQRDNQVSQDDVANNIDPPSPARACSPVKMAKDVVPSSPVVDDELNITGKPLKLQKPQMC